MNLRDYISTYGGIFGLLTFTISIILFFTTVDEVALIVNTLTIFTLNPYVTFQAYWENKNDLFRVQNMWYGKVGSIISMVSLLNLIWYNYLVYSVSNSILITIIVFLIMMLFIPKLLISLMIREDEF